MCGHICTELNKSPWGSLHVINIYNMSMSIRLLEIYDKQIFFKRELNVHEKSKNANGQDVFFLFVHHFAINNN